MKTLSLCALVLFLPASWGATLAHDYNLTSSLNDLVGSQALSSDGGSITPTGYSFGADQGLNVSSVLSNTGDYSILMDFSFDLTSGYRKILDYKNLTSDNGVYNLNTDLNYYPFSFGPAGALTAGTLARVVVTRDAGTGLVDGYVDGTLEFSFTDSTNDATFTGTNGIMRFFEDDTATGGRESSSGLATRISIYNGALTADQVAALGGPQGPSNTPEPVSFLLLGTGLACVGFAARRK